MKNKYDHMSHSEKDAIFEDAINCMVSALEYRDLYTKGHSRRVGEMAAFLARNLGLGEEDCFYIEIAGQLHDIGKIGIPDHILLKNSRLSPLEWREMKRHPAISADIISEAGHLGQIAQIVYQHHERWDGTGYPEGIKENQIQLGGRILALCDALDAMASNRAYRKSLTWTTIEEEIFKNMGLQFDPGLAPHVKDLINYWINNFETKYDNVMQSNMQVDNLMDQHQKIRTIIEDIQAYLKLDQEADVLGILSTKINKLSSVLRLHLSSEDRYLYPQLLESDNQDVKGLAEYYDQTMGGLSNAFISFKTRYNTYDSITQDYEKFKGELLSIFAALTIRLDKEDHELYPLIQSL